MPGITLEQAQTQLDLWVAADSAVATGQSYSIGTRTLTRANAAEITDKIKFWDSKVQALSRGNGGLRMRGVTPYD